VRLILPILCLALVACGGGDDTQITFPDARPDASEAPVDATISDAFQISGDALAACNAAATALEDELYETFGGCTAAVRLDYQTHALTSYAITCGTYAAAIESTSRTQAMTDTGFGATGTMVNPADPYDHYVFLEADGVGVVSVATSLSVFGGEIGTGSAGDPTHPAMWRPATDLSQGCPPSGGIPRSRGWDLRDGTALGDGDVEEAVDVVLGTALIDAFWSPVGRAFDATVLLYPRQLGPFDSATAEWVVLVNGGHVK
jgi:hypothetical protein